MTPQEAIRKDRGDTMRSWREELKYSQSKMAYTIGEFPSGYSRMERGLIDNKRAFLKMRELHEAMSKDKV